MKTKQTPRRQLVLTIMITAVITTVVIGGATYLWEHYFLQPQSGSQREATATERQSPIPSDGRVLLTKENKSRYRRDDASCDNEFNTDAATMVIPYVNREKGISFTVPYNPAWGNEKFRINPYEEVQGDLSYHVEYGPLVVFEGCGWDRTNSVSFSEPKSASAYIAELKAENDYPESYSLPPTIVHINGLEVVKYMTDGFCSYPTMVVIGKKHNYSFGPICGGKEDFPTLEKTIKTIKLLD